jgi:hypothetical protein
MTINIIAMTKEAVNLQQEITGSYTVLGLICSHFILFAFNAFIFWFVSDKFFNNDKKGNKRYYAVCIINVITSIFVVASLFKNLYNIIH